MTKLEKLYSIIENSRDVGVKHPEDVIQQAEELAPSMFANIGISNAYMSYNINKLPENIIKSRGKTRRTLF